MGDPAFASSRLQTTAETESDLHKNVIAAKRDYDAAAEARSKLVGKILKEDPAGVTARRQALDNEQRSLDIYVSALRKYNAFLLDGKSPNQP